MKKKLPMTEFEVKLLQIEGKINSTPKESYKQLVALKKSAQNVEKRLVLYCDVLMGRCLQRQGKNSKALPLILSATRQLEEIGASREAAMGYHFMSQITIITGDAQTAHEYCIRGLIIAKQAHDWYTVMLLQIDMSPIFNSMGDHKTCLKIHLDNKAIFEKHIKGKEFPVHIDEEYTSFIITLNIAFYYRMLGDYSSALSYLDSVADVVGTLMNGMYIDRYHAEYAGICLELGKIDQASEHADIVIDRLSRNCSTFARSVPNNCIVLASKLIFRDILDKGFRLLELVSDTVVRENDSYILRSYYYALAIYYKKIGNFEESVKYYDLSSKYGEIEDEKRANSTRENLLRREELQRYVNQRDRLEKSNKAGKVALTAAKAASKAKSNFMSRMSHEIRTPLNAIIGYNTLATDTISNAKDKADYAQALMKVSDCLAKSSIASKHLLSIINDILDMSAIESGKVKLSRERFDFKGLVSSITSVFYTQAKAKGVIFEVTLATLTEEWFVGDQMRVNQILANLLSNAIKFTPTDGMVKLIISQPEAETNAAHIHFEVVDTGIGMSEEFLDNIWTPFEQADASISRRFGGTGLGLSITKNLIDIMGGKISVQSKEGEGSTFAVDLTFGRTEQPKDSTSYDFSDVNALVVDDDASTCEYVKLLFGRFGARCTTTTSGAEAVTAFAEAQKTNPFTLCIIDWRMPRMDGIETAKQIRAIQNSDMPIIILTAYDFSEIADKAEKYGVTAFVSKPLFQSSLFDLLANACGKQAEKKETAKEIVNLKGLRILLVEDNEMNMEIAQNILLPTHLDVDTARNGKEAVTLFLNSPEGKYSAILMDIQMPVMDGHQATKIIRSSTHPQATTIPIIAMTADAFVENIIEALESGMNDHIAKPINLPSLYNSLEKFIKR